MASPVTRKALAFLRALQRNSYREWFRARKADDEGMRCGLCTRGGVLKRRRFYYRWDGQSLHIHRESGRHDEFPMSEIAHILKRLDDQFTAGWFPLANNVEKLSNGTEKCSRRTGGRRTCGFWRSTEVKTVPHVPRSHPFVARLIGTTRRECLDHVLFWNARDLERTLADFQVSDNEVRSHASLKGHTPLTFAGGHMVARAELNNLRWVSHCRDLVQLPVAA